MSVNGSTFPCLLDSGATHTILKNREYFSNLKLLQANVNTTLGTTKLIEGTGKACIIILWGQN